MTETHHYKGYEIPIELMMLTGGGPDTFNVISQWHFSLLDKWIGIDPNHTVLEIGCGIGRDAIPLTERLTNGKYLGIDIIKRSIDWCTANITVKHPHFSFLHFDVKDQLHNCEGTIKASDISVPLPDHSVDRIIVFSVFTHMFRLDIEHYLREFRRLLKSEGLAYATTFIFDDEILAFARRTNLTPYNLRFEHRIDVGCRINDLNAPLGAVAYTRQAWDEMVEKCGLRYARSFLNGAWSGYYDDPDEGQDVAILAPTP